MLIPWLLRLLGRTSVEQEYLVVGAVIDLSLEVVARELTPEVVALDLTPHVIARDLN